MPAQHGWKAAILVCRPVNRNYSAISGYLGNCKNGRVVASVGLCNRTKNVVMMSSVSFPPAGRLRVGLPTDRQLLAKL